MSATTITNLPQLPAAIRELAGHLRTGMADNASNDQKTKKDALPSLLKDAPESVRASFPTIEAIKQVWAFESQLADANTLATGDEGVDRMKKDKEVGEFSHTLNLSVDGYSREITSTVKRSVTSFGKETKGVVNSRIGAVKSGKHSSYADIKSFIAGRGAELA